VEPAIYNEDIEEEMLRLGYKGIMQKSSHIHGNAIFFDSAKFDLEFTNSRSRALIIGLRPKLDEGDVIAVASVHLQGHPDDTATRFNQIKSLLDQIKKDLKVKDDESGSASRVFITGDFNCNIHSGIHTLLTQGNLPADFVDGESQKPHNKVPYSHPFVLKNSYLTAEESPIFTFKGKNHADLFIDFIFYSTPTTKVDAVMKVADREEVRCIRETWLPNENHPSDHLPVASLFTFT